jgi:phosphomannomutase/phosphoglucomutase
VKFYRISTPEIRIECPDALKFQVVDKVKDFFREGYDIIDIDGVRVRFDNGWGLVRASNTQPVIVLRFESPTPEGLRSIRTFIENVVNDAMASVRQTYPL